MTNRITQSITTPFNHLEGVDISLPQVSVVICNYNQGHLIKEAIISVASQNYQNLECIVVDDKSTDNSLDLIRSALDEVKDRRFRIVECDRNGGQMAAMYAGFDATTAPFVAFLDADDIWLPSFLEKHIACHINSEICAAVSSSNLAIIESGGALVAGTRYSGVRFVTAMLGGGEREQVFRVHTPALRREANNPEQDWKFNTVFLKNDYNRGWLWSATSGLMFRRAVLQAIRPYNVEDFQICADYYLANFAHMLGGSLVTTEAHGYYRIHENNMWAKHAVLGDGAAMGTDPRSIGVATSRTILQKLCTEKFFQDVMPNEHRSNVITRLAKQSSLHQWVLSSPAIKKGIPAKLRRKMRRRVVVEAIRSIFRRRPSQEK